MRRLIVITLVTGSVAVVAASCGGGDDGTFATLPAVRVTSTTSTTTTTENTDRRYYTVKPGESLAIIAESFEVPVAAIVELNGIENPNSIQAGQTIEIPRGVQLITELPTTTTTDG